MKITSVELKTGKNGKTYKSCKMDAKVFGRDMFNVFPFHTRYDDVRVDMVLSESDIARDGEYIKLVDPDAGIKKPYSGGGNGGGASVAVLKEILEQLKTISSQLGFYQTYVTRGEKPLDTKPVAPKYPDFDEKVDASNIPF